MKRHYPIIRKAVSLLILCLLTGSSLVGQDTSQMGFTDLQKTADGLVQNGQLVEAMPLLKELIDRVEKTENSEIMLDFPIFLVGTGYIQQFVNTGDEALLREALKWYDKLEKDYPQSQRNKDALLKRVDVLRVLGENEAAVDIMKRLLREDQYRLSFSEQTQLLKNITQTFYSSGNLSEGLPYFARLLESSRNPEEQALAAAASFEALFDAKRMDDAIRLLPYLVKDSEIRYRPRLNVALLKASDLLADAERLNDAALILNLIKTTDIMIQYHETQIEQKKATLDQRIAFGNAADQVERLKQEISSLEANLEQLRTLPTLRNELLVRRARNYTKSERRYEAFWMFYDLMVTNPDHKQAEFYTYASFSNALQIGKNETAIEIGKDYRTRFPAGEYYSDVSVALANQLRENNNPEEFLSIAQDFLTKRPLDAASGTLYAQWASYLIENRQFQEMIEQTSAWLEMTQNPIFEDAAYYWTGQAQMQLAEFTKATQSFDQLLNKFPKSSYAEDTLLRKGTALYYDQSYSASRDVLLSYTEQYPSGNALDQAYYFLGEVEAVAGNSAPAFKYFEKADSITKLQEIHDGVAFRVGGIYESMGEYDKMISVFESYIDKYWSTGRLTDAVFQLGRGFEFSMRPTEMLALYRKFIEQYCNDPKNQGVDTLIEGYAEKYNTNLTMLKTTVEFIDRIKADSDFRTKLFTDRGFLFEQFYLNQQINQELYNQLRTHPAFGPNLASDLSPIESILEPFYQELAKYPSQNPEAYFRELYTKYKERGGQIGEVRALMGLYRSGIELEPSIAYDTEFLSEVTPRVILYIADYARDKNISLSISAWNEVLSRYPFNDAAIVALLRLAEVNETNGDLPAALNYLEQILTQFQGSPKTPAVILRQGELLTKMGRTKEAREKYQYILRVPDWRGVTHARALYQTGESYLADGAYPEAHGFFERTFLGYTHFAEWCAKAYLADAEALIKMRAPQDAITTLQEAVNTLGDSAPDEIMQAIRAKIKELQS